MNTRKENVGPSHSNALGGSVGTTPPPVCVLPFSSHISLPSDSADLLLRNNSCSQNFLREDFDPLSGLEDPQFGDAEPARLPHLDWETGLAEHRETGDSQLFGGSAL